MSKGLFVVGTDTDVGKTIITAGLVYLLRKNNFKACSFKAVQSGAINKNGNLIAGDTRLVQKICNLEEKQKKMTAYCLEPAVSPHFAAHLEGIEIKKEQVINKYKNLAQEYNYIVAEGSGGLVVPLIKNEYFIYDLVKDLNLPVVIVGRAAVGTINHTVLTFDFCRKIGLNVKGIILNKYSGKIYEKDNIKTLENITGQDVITVINNIKKFDNNYMELKREFECKLDISRLLDLFNFVN